MAPNPSFPSPESRVPSPGLFVLNRHGFTLFELMIVLFLITLALGLTMFYFANAMPSNKLSATARELSATIRYARSLAQIENTSRMLNINLDAKTYGIKGLNQNKIIDPAITIRLLDPSAGELANGSYNLVFHASGGMEGGTIILRTARREIRIELDPIVGSLVIK
jgi:prepilin-type N-terminal cleavage/methylation domain-containing protein